MSSSKFFYLTPLCPLVLLSFKWEKIFLSFVSTPLCPLVLLSFPSGKKYFYQYFHTQSIYLKTVKIIDHLSLPVSIYIGIISYSKYLNIYLPFYCLHPSSLILCVAINIFQNLMTSAIVQNISPICLDRFVNVLCLHHFNPF